ncbi:hypothetical protein [Pararhizobium arenae]|jgi:hypothetical protein|nr:hypothetical protein [Pararhizobium arenae]
MPVAFTLAAGIAISRLHQNPNSRSGKMRSEIENIVDEIKQAISLLRRHL